jgi:hypothetical protein
MAYTFNGKLHFRITDAVKQAKAELQAKQQEKKRFVDEFPKTYEQIKDLNNELDGYAILRFCNGIEIDETSAKHLETLRELTSKAVDVAHELMEHLAWDKY